MTKEFEAIKDDKLRIGLLGLKRVVEANAKKMTKDEIMAFDFTFMNITNALLELQAIKEAEPSEALKWLNQQIQRLNDDLQHYTMVEKDKAIEYQISEDLKELNTIKATLLKAEKLEKAWEVIKPLCEVVETPKLKDRYLKINGVVVYTIKNQQEFELLTEVLK